MTVTLNLNPEVEKNLMARAYARGVSLDDYLRNLSPGKRACPSLESRAPFIRGSIIFPTYGEEV